MVQDFQRKNPQVNLQLIVNKTNQGSAKSRNIGINVANGEYITFLDDDDVYLHPKIERQLKSMIMENSDYCITDLYLYNNKDMLVDRRIRNYITDKKQESLLKYHLMYHMTGTDSLMFKKDYLIKIGGFPPIDVGDEFYLMLNAISGGGVLNYLPGCDVKAYVHYDNETGLSIGDSKINGENQLYQFKKKYFAQLDSKSRRYIRMRHYAVIAFAEIRRKRYGAFVLNGIKSFFCAPVFCLKLLLKEK